jgi:putative transposase
LRVKIRDEGLMRNKAIHIALGVRADGTKEVLGLWIEQNESAKFWLRVMNESKNRGAEDVLLTVVDGLKAFPRRSTPSLRAVATALKDIYRATDDLAAATALDSFEAGLWGEKYPAIVQSWRRAWPEVIPFYAFPTDGRRILWPLRMMKIEKGAFAFLREAAAAFPFRLPSVLTDNGSSFTPAFERACARLCTASAQDAPHVANERHG